MAAGLPVVVTDIPGSRDIVKNEINGLIVPHSDPNELARAIIRILNEKGFSEKILKNAKAESKKYDWRAIAKKYLSVYEKSLNNSV